MTSLTQLTTKYRPNSLGIDVPNPRFAWKLQNDRQEARQTAYQIHAASSLDELSPEQADLWDSGRVDTDHVVHVVHGASPWKSHQRVGWKVTVWDETGVSTTSETTWFEMGLLRANDGHAQGIGTAFAGATQYLPCSFFRKRFTLPDQNLHSHKTTSKGSTRFESTAKEITQ
jgi:alpha-L-rhamnosidase